MKIIHLDKKTKKDILENLLRRDPNSYSQYEETVKTIVEEVRKKGDKALLSYTEQFDHIRMKPSEMLVSEKEIEEAVSGVSPDLLKVMEKSLENIRSYHEMQKRTSWFHTGADGTILGQKITPLNRVGVYVPGGKAAYPSTVLMNIVPAHVAGVPEIIMTTPAHDGIINPVTLAAAHMAGATKIYKAGGAQAIAAMAFGTKTIPKTDKIVGPGNIFVALAKKCVYGHVSIDSIAGPSEILVIADQSADPKYAAADLLSQAEHDEMASAILITTDQKLAEEVNKEIAVFLKTLSRRDIIQKSLDHYGYILLADDMESAVETANDIASEHLELMTENPFELLTKIRNAGAVFLGPYSSEPLGDYYAGPNHVLPTNGTAKFFSPLSVDDFIKKTSVIYYSEPALKAASRNIEAFAKAEGLTAHANSISVRFSGKKQRKRSSNGKGN